MCLRPAKLTHQPCQCGRFMQALLDQQETKKDALVKDFGNRIRQQQKRNADLKQGSGKRDEECKVLKRAFEQHKAEA